MEPETSSHTWLFQLDDLESFPWKNGWKSPVRSILNLLFGVPGISQTPFDKY